MYVLFGHSAHYILKQGLSFNLEFTDLARLSGQPASHRSPHFHFPSTGTMVLCLCPQLFCMSAGDLNSDPHTQHRIPSFLDKLTIQAEADF